MSQTNEVNGGTNSNKDASLRKVHSGIKDISLRFVRNEANSETKETDKLVDNPENEERSSPIFSKLLYIPPANNEEELFMTKPEEVGINIKAVLNSTTGTKNSTIRAMSYPAPLRDYRKRNKTVQATMLRNIRSAKPAIKTNGTASCESTPGSSTDSLESIKIESVITLAGAKNSSSIDNEQPDPTSATPSMKSDESGSADGSEDNADSSVERPNSVNEDDNIIVNLNSKSRKRRIIDSDDESLPDPKRHLSESSKNLSPEMVESLIDMYCELYPKINRMEMYDHIRELDFDFVALTKRLDAINKHTPIDMQTMRLHRLAEERRLRDAMKAEDRQRKVMERAQKKSKLAQERKKKKKVWQAKGKTAQDYVDEDEEDFVKTVKVYESDSSDEEEAVSSDNQDQAKNSSRNLVLNFYQTASITEMMAIPGCSKKKVDIMIECRPFADWDDLVTKFKTSKHINTDMLNNAVQLLVMRDTISRLMKRCENISSEIRSAVSGVMEDGDTENTCKISQPAILNNNLTLKSYQVIGLNWLALMYQQGINGVLADEMGLGKTIQAIAFLAYLKERNELDQLCLIVVPSSTLDNWAKELELWCPSLGVLVYHGSQDERRGMRMAIANDDLDENIYVMLTTYNMVGISPEDRGLFKKIPFHTVIFDEAHMLKNMATMRFENLMKIRAKNRLLLTGTPLQNNLVELMSILVFVMPQLFEGKKEMLKKIFSMFPKTECKDSRGQYEKMRIEQAKRIMGPFFLRRLKNDVLKDLPPKEEHLLNISMSDRQQKIYKDTIQIFNDKAAEIKKEILNSKEEDVLNLTDEVERNPKNKKLIKDSSSNILMTLRKISNHPLLVRSLYTEDQLEVLAKTLQQTTHRESLLEYIVQDLSIMSDFEIHKTCLMYTAISSHRLSNDIILDSGKFNKFDEVLPVLKEKGDRVLIFSQFCIMLDIIEDYMKIRGHTFHRLDGRTQVSERQEKIDDFNENDDVFAFLLSTRAGGLGINLSSANNVILHDIDFNPYNDKQAEDRCHRLGQRRNVNVFRYLSKDTIEEGIYNIGRNKLQLEKDVTGVGESRKADVLQLLESALATQ